MVRTEGLGRVIDEHPFFQGIDGKLRATLAGCATNMRVEAGEYLFRQGGPAEQFYLLRRGRIAIEIHAPARPPLIVETVGEDDVVGWSWLVPPYRWTFDARALELTRLVALDAACLRRKMEEDTELGFEVMRRFVPVIAHRLASTRLQVLDLYGPPSGAGGRA